MKYVHGSCLPTEGFVFLFIPFWYLHSSATEHNPVWQTWRPYFLCCSSVTLLPTLSLWFDSEKRRSRPLSSSLCNFALFSNHHVPRSHCSTSDWLLELLLPPPLWALLCRNCMKPVPSKIHLLTLLACKNILRLYQWRLFFFPRKAQVLHTGIQKLIKNLLGPGLLNTCLHNMNESSVYI